ncbi:MAG: REP-associated tyrosine transposase [Gaiellaceae bacterium]|nr:REP-associated tyrosine transposase [Gaiellaceae bacterium]
MSRPLRPLVADATYNVSVKGVADTVIVRGDSDRRCWLALLATVTLRLGWRLHEYCLMDTHFHLLLRTPEPNLSAGMQRLNGGYAQLFNRRHRREGHLFSGRFFSRIIEDERHRIELHRYIARNPVRAGMCTDPAAYRWSSHAALIGRVKAPPFLAVDEVLRLFGRTRAAARRALREFVAAEPRGP